MKEARRQKAEAELREFFRKEEEERQRRAEELRIKEEERRIQEQCDQIVLFVVQQPLDCYLS